MSINQNVRDVFNRMIDLGQIPRIGTFDVTPIMIQEVIDTYELVNPQKTNWNPRPSEVRYFRKLTGINRLVLLK
jgi:hypothetical protein